MVWTGVAVVAGAGMAHTVDLMKRLITPLVALALVAGAAGTAVPAHASEPAVRPLAAAPITGTPTEILAVTPVAQPLTVGYEPGLFVSPATVKKKDRRGCTYRNRVLIALAAKKPKIGAKCTLIGGEWVADFGYTVIKNARQVRLGKLLPDKYVYAQGAYGWSPQQRAAYGNSILAPKVSSRGRQMAPFEINNIQAVSPRSVAFMNILNRTIDRNILNQRALEIELAALRDRNPGLFDAWTVTTLLNTKAWGLSLSPGVAGNFNVTIEKCVELQTVTFNGVQYTLIDLGKTSSPRDGPRQIVNVCTNTYTFPNQAGFYNITAVPTAASSVAPLFDTVRLGYGSPVGPEIQRFLFGIHAPAHWVSDGASGFEGPVTEDSIPNVPVGAVRLWDTETAWADIEPEDGKFVYSNLRKQIELAQRLNARPMLVLGGTPRWAGGGGRNAVPRNVADFKEYVRAVACFAGESIFAYEVWNEANIKDFWAGTPAQMADLTEAAFEAIRGCNPNALVVAASTTTRATGSFGTFYPEYLSELKKRNWPVDAYSVHSYPAAAGGADARIQGIGQFRTMLALAGAPKTTTFDTETNYGLAGLGQDRIAYTGATAQALIARTYIDSARYDIDATYWFVWTRGEDTKYGIQMNPTSTVEATAWRTTYSWLVGSRFQRCFQTSLGVTVCQFSKGGQNFSIVWFGDMGGTPISTPSGYFSQLGSRGCDLNGTCVPLTSSSIISVGPAPLRIDSGP